MSLKKFLIVELVSGLCFVGCSAVEWFGHDSVFEEIVEDYIKDKTGVEVDLTGDSPEG